MVMCSVSSNIVIEKKKKQPFPRTFSWEQLTLDGIFSCKETLITLKRVYFKVLSDERNVNNNNYKRVFGQVSLRVFSRDEWFLPEENLFCKAS